LNNIYYSKVVADQYTFQIDLWGSITEAYYTPEVSRKIDIVMKKFHESKLLLHPIAAGELSFDEVVA
jgi:hypothetical protein